jgi:hypothetical protein
MTNVLSLQTLALDTVDAVSNSNISIACTGHSSASYQCAVVRTQAA